MMQRDKVKSSAIKSIGFDQDTNQMEVQFMSGHKSVYENVKREEMEALRDAPSVGKHFNEYWRTR